MNKYSKKVILIDTVNKVAYDLTVLSDKLSQGVGTTDIIESIDTITNELSLNVLQYAVTERDSGEEYLMETAYSILLLSYFKREAKHDPELYADLSKMMESV